jgi:hypothetical protein
MGPAGAGPGEGEAGTCRGRGGGHRRGGSGGSLVLRRRRRHAQAQTGFSSGGEPARARPVPEEVRREGWGARRGGAPRLRDGVRVWAGGSRRRGEAGRRRPSSPRMSRSAADPAFAGPAVRARVRARDGRGQGRAGRRRAGRGGGESGGRRESVALASLAGRRKLAERPRPVCGPPLPLSASAARAGTARGRPALAGPSTAVEDRALRVELEIGAK